jgi:signal peptidase I
MENTLLVGDFLLVNKAIYGATLPGTKIRLPAWAEPERGDVIVFNPPHEPDKNYVKRAKFCS